jgi:hypothetical protein
MRRSWAVDKAWVRFDPSNGDIIGISWEKDSDDLIEISGDLAESFMSGKTRVVAFKVTTENGVHVLSSIDEKPVLPEFWNLRETGGIDYDNDIVVSGNMIIAKVDGLHRFLNLFATLKNDPSWLIKTWNLREFPVVNGEILINWPDANKHSFYMSKTNEA